MGQGRVEERGLLLVVELLPARAGLVLSGHPVRRNREHRDQVTLQRVLVQDLGQRLDEPRALNGVSPGVEAGNG